MAEYKITVSGKNLRQTTVDKLVKALEDKDLSVTVTKIEHPTSRADRFAAALGTVEDGKLDLEELRDELQEWYDNLPENFQDGDKGQEIQEAIDALNDAIDNLENTIGADVNFPGMY